MPLFALADATLRRGVESGSFLSRPDTSRWVIEPTPYHEDWIDERREVSAEGGRPRFRKIESINGSGVSPKEKDADVRLFL